MGKLAVLGDLIFLGGEAKLVQRIDSTEKIPQRSRRADSAAMMESQAPLDVDEVAQSDRPCDWHIEAVGGLGGRHEEEKEDDDERG